MCRNRYLRLPSNLRRISCTDFLGESNATHLRGFRADRLRGRLPLLPRRQPDATLSRRSGDFQARLAAYGVTTAGAAALPQSAGMRDTLNRLFQPAADRMG